MSTAEIVSAGAGAATGLLSMIGQKKREKRAVANQTKLMGIQKENQKELDEHGHALQKKMWEETNYPAQMKMIEQAGLSAGLIYGGSGAGGATTGSQGGGAASGGNAPAPQPMEIGTALQAAAQVALLKAQKENIEADTENKKSGADYTAGVQTKSTEQDVINKELKNKEEIERSKYYEDMAGSEALTKDETWRKLSMENSMTRENWDIIVKKAKAEAGNEEIKGRILRADAEVREFEAQLAKDGIPPNSPWYAKLLGDLLNKLGVLDLVGIGKQSVKKQITGK